MSSVREVNEMLRPLMTRVSEEVLQPDGFAASTGRVHRRPVEGMRQIVTFGVFRRARYLHGRHHLVLRIDLEFPAFKDLVRTMLREDREAVLGLPTDVLRKESGISSPMWGFDSERSASDLFDSVEVTLRKGVLPYLDARRTPGALADLTLELVSMDDPPGSIDHRGTHPVFGAAAAVHLGRLDQAREILERAYAHDQYLRRDHEPAFAEVERRESG